MTLIYVLVIFCLLVFRQKPLNALITTDLTYTLTKKLERKNVNGSFEVFGLMIVGVVFVCCELCIPTCIN